MRISDWSSDVCSSDLVDRRDHRDQVAYLVRMQRRIAQRERAALADAEQVDRVQVVRVAQVVDGAAEEAFDVVLQGEEPVGAVGVAPVDDVDIRSEEHTSELQSLMRISYAVFCLKKKK